MRTHKEVTEEVERLGDELTVPVDEGIKKLVIALRMHNFPTSGSCEGHLEHALPYPWVDIDAPEQEENAWLTANKRERTRLKQLLSAFYDTNKTTAIFQFQDIGIFGAFRLVPRAAGTIQHPTKELLLNQLKNLDKLADYLLAAAKNSRDLSA